jgi:Restriction endonuclease
MSRSRYDELHDKYDAILTTKSGTRYERLAAMVFKALEESTAVIHDVSLLGESDVSHQIDVHVTVEGQSRRVLIECKDFDISGDKVGLPIVRNFWAVLDDTRADEGFIITCNGFTDDAAKYAKAKGIKLVVLRIHEEKDWEGFIKTVVVRLLALAPANPIMTIAVPDDAERQRFASAMQSLHRPGGIHLGDPVFMVKDQERIHFNEFMTARMNKAIPLKDDAPDRASVRVANDGWKIEIRGTPPLTFDHVDIAFDVHKHEREIVVTSGRVAELILSGFGDADIIIFGDQLERRKINPETGEVI